jgi:purine-binding chemotaxis protein CheW
MDVFNFISPERKREILETRARRLASSTRPQTSDSDGTQFLCFRLSGHEWYLDTSRVRQVFPLDCSQLTVLPGAPDYVLGATNVRGQVMGVLDPARLLQESSKLPLELRWESGHQPLLIVSHLGNELGLLVESILGVLPTRPEGAEPFQTLDLDRLLDFERKAVASHGRA